MRKVIAVTSSICLVIGFCAALVGSVQTAEFFTLAAAGGFLLATIRN